MRTTATDDDEWFVTFDGERRGIADEQEDYRRQPPSIPWRGAFDWVGRAGTNDLTAHELLSWRWRALPLIGRDADQQALLDWARSGDGVAVRFLWGPAGVGKNRLAAEVAKELQREGWVAGFADWNRDLEWSIGEAGALLILDEVPQPGDGAWTALDRIQEDSHGMAPRRRVLVLGREPDRQDPLGPHASIQHLGPLSEGAALNLYTLTRQVWGDRVGADGLAVAETWPDADIARRPLHVMAAALSSRDGPPATDCEVFAVIARNHADARHGDAPDLWRAAVDEQLHPACGESLSGGALACLAVQRALDASLDHGGSLQISRNAWDVARLDRLVEDGKLPAYDRERLAAAFASRFWTQSWLIESLNAYPSVPGSLLSRTAVRLSAQHVARAAASYGTELMRQAAQLARELGPQAAITPAERAAAIYRTGGDVDDPGRAPSRWAFDCLWMLAHYQEQAGAPEAVGVRHELTRFTAPAVESVEERMLAYQLLGDCQLADATARRAALQTAIDYHRGCGRTLLLALSLEQWASLASPDEGQAALTEAAGIRRLRPAAEATWRPSDPRPASGHPELTLSLVLAIHLFQERRYAGDPAVRRALASQLVIHSTGRRVAWAARDALLDIDRRVRQGSAP